MAAIECGRLARDAVAIGPIEFWAVFRHSRYLRFPGGRFACLGDTSLGVGPLNARVSAKRAMEFPASVHGRARTLLWPGRPRSVIAHATGSGSGIGA